MSWETWLIGTHSPARILLVGRYSNEASICGELALPTALLKLEGCCFGGIGPWLSPLITMRVSVAVGMALLKPLQGEMRFV